MSLFRNAANEDTITSEMLRLAASNDHLRNEVRQMREERYNRERQESYERRNVPPVGGFGETWNGYGPMEEESSGPEPEETPITGWDD